MRSQKSSSATEAVAAAVPVEVALEGADGFALAVIEASVAGGTALVVMQATRFFLTHGVMPGFIGMDSPAVWHHLCRCGGRAAELGKKLLD